MRVGVTFTPGTSLSTYDQNGQRERIERHVAAYTDAGHDVTYLDSRRPLGYRVDVIRGMSLAAAWPALVARFLCGTPCVVTYGADYDRIAQLHGEKGRKWRWLRWLAFRYGTIIVPNPVDYQRLLSRFPKAKLVHVPNWVDTDRFAPGARDWFRHRPVVLAVGRLVAEKNLIRLARACRGVGADLVCVGSGPQKQSLIAEGVWTTGPVPWLSIPAWHDYADVFALPSLTEGHPKALLEAMASGLPCAVSKTVHGVVEPGRTALMFDPEDDEGMRGALKLLLERKDIAQKLGAAAREAAMQWDYRKVLPQEIRVVEEARC